MQVYLVLIHAAALAAVSQWELVLLQLYKQRPASSRTFRRARSYMLGIRNAVDLHWPSYVHCELASARHPGTPNEKVCPRDRLLQAWILGNVSPSILRIVGSGKRNGSSR